ncbi:hypothetical protein SmJEL517_g02569 [Synchytrium microbalum]|uniref:BTB domain-containing protein n=1 Tax=Synchytrium microbalum TaxID=1806994 RepID=A0A507CBH4_9FUNG|nr:uncharacterized protein SmJEL517_g02569 [Synchytrium microbalum]TPX34905.1 hypothetical protein SmJEL517_g02569 [Synchytrium microbalum]
MKRKHEDPAAIIQLLNSIDTTNIESNLSTLTTIHTLVKTTQDLDTQALLTRIQPLWILPDERIKLPIANIVLDVCTTQRRIDEAVQHGVTELATSMLSHPPCTTIGLDLLSRLAASSAFPAGAVLHALTHVLDTHEVNELNVRAARLLDEVTYRCHKSTIDASYGIYVSVVDSLTRIYKSNQTSDLGTTYMWYCVRALAIACDKSGILKARMVGRLDDVCGAVGYYGRVVRLACRIPDVVLQPMAVQNNNVVAVTRPYVVEELACIARCVNVIVLSDLEKARNVEVIPCVVTDLVVLCADGIANWSNTDAKMDLELVKMLLHPDLLNIILTILVNTLQPTIPHIELVLNLGIVEALTRLFNTMRQVEVYVGCTDKVMKLLACVLSIQSGRRMFRILPWEDVAGAACAGIAQCMAFWNVSEKMHVRAMKVAVELLRDGISASSCRQMLGGMCARDLGDVRWCPVLLNGGNAERINLFVECHTLLAKEANLRNLVREGTFVDMVVTLVNGLCDVLLGSTSIRPASLNGALTSLLKLSLDLVIGSAKDSCLARLFPINSTNIGIVASVFRLWSIHTNMNYHLDLSLDTPQIVNKLLPTSISVSAAQALVVASKMHSSQSYILDTQTCIPLLAQIALSNPSNPGDIDVSFSCFRVLRILLLSEDAYHELVKTFGACKIMMPFIRHYRIHGTQNVEFDLVPTIYAGDSRDLSALISVLYWEASGTASSLVRAFGFYKMEGRIDVAATDAEVNDNETSREETDIDALKRAQEVSVTSILMTPPCRYNELGLLKPGGPFYMCIDILLSETDDTRRLYAALAIEWVAITHLQSWTADDSLLEACRKGHELLCCVVENGEGLVVRDLDGIELKGDEVVLVVPDDTPHKGLIISRSRACSVSPVMSTMLSDTRYKDGGATQVAVHQMSLQDMKNLLGWVVHEDEDTYSSIPDLDTVIGLLRSADRFLCDGLRKACIEHLNYRFLRRDGRVALHAARDALKVVNCGVCEDDTLYETCVKCLFVGLSEVSGEELRRVFEWCGGRDGVAEFILNS